MQRKNKQLLREQMIKKLKSMSKKEKMIIENHLISHLFASPLWKKANIIGLTCATNIEWNTEHIMIRAWNDDKIVAIPKTFPAKSVMRFYEVHSFNELKKGYANILEPVANENRHVQKEQIDLLIVPGVVFDRFGYRIGFGGGYYDRYLNDFPNTTVSLVSSIQIIDCIPVEKHDVHVQYLITEEGFYKINEVSEV